MCQYSQSESGGSVNFIEKTDPSHLQYNDQWKYDSRNLNGLYNYINQLTLGANTLLGKVLEDKVYPNNSIFSWYTKVWILKEVPAEKCNSE